MVLEQVLFVGKMDVHWIFTRFGILKCIIKKNTQAVSVTQQHHRAFMKLLVQTVSVMKLEMNQN
jgi:hypothetical protein